MQNVKYDFLSSQPFTQFLLNFGIVFLAGHVSRTLQNVGVSQVGENGFCAGNGFSAGEKQVVISYHDISRWWKCCTSAAWSNFGRR